MSNQFTAFDVYRKSDPFTTAPGTVEGSQIGQFQIPSPSASTTTASVSRTVPAKGATLLGLIVGNTSGWLQPDDRVNIPGAGRFKVLSIPDGTHLDLLYEDIPDNTRAGATIVAGTFVMIGSLRDTTPGPAYYRLIDRTSDGPVVANNDVSLSDPPGTVKWAKHFGGTGYDRAVGVAHFVRSGVDEIIVAANSPSTSVEYGAGPFTPAGPANLIVAKYRSDGNCIWAISFGEAGKYLSAITIATDSVGNILVGASGYGTFTFGSSTIYLNVSGGTGYPSSTCVFKINGVTGVPMWAIGLTGTVACIATSPIDNSVVTVGSFGQTFQTYEAGGALQSWATSSSQFSSFLIKCSSSGLGMLANFFSFAGNNTNKATSVIVDSLGKVLVAGEIVGNYDVSNSVLGGPHGDSQHTGIGGVDVYLIKVQSDLTYSISAGNWNRQFGTSMDDGFPCIAVDSQNNVGLTFLYRNVTLDLGDGVSVTQPLFVRDPSYPGGLPTMVIAKLNGSNGVTLWGQTVTEQPGSLPSITVQEPHGIAFDSFDNVRICGWFTRVVNFGTGRVTADANNNTYILNYKSNGVILWTTKLGGYTVPASALVCDSQNGVYAIGETSGGDFGGVTLTSYGSNDAFLVKIVP